MILIESEEDLLSKEQTEDGEEREAAENSLDSSANDEKYEGRGDDASSNSNLSVPKGLACFRQQHLDTINEGNSSIEVSDTQSQYQRSMKEGTTMICHDNSSPFGPNLIISDGKNQQSAGINMLEKMTKAKLIKRQAQLQENSEPYMM